MALVFVPEVVEVEAATVVDSDMAVVMGSSGSVPCGIFEFGVGSNQSKLTTSNNTTWQ